MENTASFFSDAALPALPEGAADDSALDAAGAAVDVDAGSDDVEDAVDVDAGSDDVEDAEHPDMQMAASAIASNNASPFVAWIFS